MSGVCARGERRTHGGDGGGEGAAGDVDDTAGKHFGVVAGWLCGNGGNEDGAIDSRKQEKEMRERINEMKKK